MSLPPITVYTAPIELQTSWKSRMEKEGLHPIGLSALYNHAGQIIVGLFPKDRPRPDLNTLIRINDSEPKPLYNPRVDRSEYFVYVHDWEEKAATDIYQEFDVDADYAGGILRDHTFLHESDFASLVHPLFSAPPTQITDGGGSLSNLSVRARGRDVDNLLDLLLSLGPPELRASKPPSTLQKGALQEIRKGIKVRAAERFPRAQQRIDTLRAQKQEKVNRRLDGRPGHLTEDSLYAVLKPKTSARRQAFKGVLLNFSRPDTFIPETTEDLLRQGFEFKGLRKEADERLWASLLQNRQRSPTMGDTAEELATHLDQLREVLDLSLVGTITNDGERNRLVEKLIGPATFGLTRLSMSIARRRDLDLVSPRVLDDARRIQERNIEVFTDHPFIQNLRLDYPKRRQNIRVDLVQNVLLDQGALNPEAIWQQLDGREEFEDFEDLMGLLQWLQRKGKTIPKPDGRYLWI